VFVEGARHTATTTVYGRFEAVQSETAVLLSSTATEGVTIPETCPSVVHCLGLDDRRHDTVLALTAGAVRDVLSWRGLEGGVGADVTFYGVPSALEPAYSSHPISFHVFFRLRPPAGPMGRMWNMRMSQPMAGHSISQ
jgi:hypothetical protein